MFLLSKEYWEVRKTKKKGNGVFALKDIEAGTVIGDYIGMVIPSKKEIEFEEKFGFYSMYYHKKVSIFPEVKKDGIHLINHSCAPNLGMYTYKRHTLYFAIRKIFAGEELCISYMLGPEDQTTSDSISKCFCESFNCTGSMHLSEKEFDAWVDYDNKKEKETKPERVRIGTVLPILSAYPKTISDHVTYRMIGNQQKRPFSVFDTKLPNTKQLRNMVRTTGRRVRFSKLNLTVYGVVNGMLLTDIKK